MINMRPSRETGLQTLNSIKITFLNSSHHTLSNYIYFVWFRRGPHCPIVFHCFGNDIIIKSFLVTWFSNLHIFRTLNGLSACKVSILQVFHGKFYRQIKKNTMMTSSKRHFMLLEFENLKFSKTEYRLSFLQGSNLLIVGIEFYEG